MLELDIITVAQILWRIDVVDSCVERNIQGIARLRRNAMGGHGFQSVGEAAVPI
jgi:hypothetical protein